MTGICLGNREDNVLKTRIWGVLEMVVRDSDKNFVEPLKGVKRKTLAVGEKGMLTRFVLLAGAELPGHSHPHEQIGYLITGDMVLTISDQDYRLTAGDSWAIPGGSEHSVKVLEQIEAIEVFVPVREDYFD